MGAEIERKFLVPDRPGWLGDFDSDRIRQGYVALEGGTEVRVRERGSTCTLTVKRGRGRVRAEVDLPIDVGRFEELWPLSEGRRVVKRRYVVPSGDLRFEVDVYEEDLAGLIVAEVEFSTEGEGEAFDPPDWLGREVTDDDAFKNRSLAVQGRPG